jgi:hypothetical protein
MTDKNGNSISVGSVLRHPDGSVNRVRAIVSVGNGSVAKAAECTVVTDFVGGKDDTQAGDCVVWGS